MLTNIVMLPFEKWKVARIIKFRFRDHLCDCDGAVIYIRPFTTTYNIENQDIVDNCICEAIKASYSDCQILSKSLEWEHSYSDLTQVYDGGRPKSSLTIRMTPSLSPDLLPKLVGQYFYAYDFKFNVFLDFIGNQENIPQTIFLTHGFPYNEHHLFNTTLDEIETL